MAVHPNTINPQTISDVLKRSAELADVSDTPRLDVEVLLGHILEKDRTFLYTWPEHQLSDSQQQAFDAFFQRRLQGEPVAHITGQREFWSLPFKVTPATLIPRPETELLVELALKLPLSEQSSVLDLGTGTGAIALAIACERSDWHITATDAVEAAVQLAEENRQQFGFDHVQILQSDWFSNVEGLFDLIVSNPPYICEGDSHLVEGDVRFEPASALVADEQGLADLQAIIIGARLHLKPGGWLLLEHGFDQGAAVREMLLGAGYSGVVTHADLAGKDRASLGCLVDC